jgi:hypothetical protein
MGGLRGSIRRGIRGWPQEDPMRSPRGAWTILVLLYLAFFGWYTSFGGPLDPEEIDHYAEALAQRGGDAARVEQWRHFMQTDTGDDFAMLNAIDMRDKPLPVEGASPNASSAEVLRLYTQPFMLQAIRSAAHPVFLGSAAADALDIWGIEGADEWSIGGLVRYHSRRDLMEQALFASTLDIHDYKIAAMEKTIAFPVDPWFQLGDPRLLLALVFLVIGLGVQLRSALRRAAALEVSSG